MIDIKNVILKYSCIKILSVIIKIDHFPLLLYKIEFYFKFQAFTINYTDFKERNITAW